MSGRERDHLVVGAGEHKVPEIDVWLWALEDNRRKTLEIVEAIPEAVLDWLPSAGESSLGSVLRHIADIEADWLYAEVLVKPIPEEVLALFPDSEKDPDRAGRRMHLEQAKGFTLEQHLDRLQRVREKLLPVFRAMDLADFRRVRELEPYDVTPEWVLYHLIEHEAEHRGQAIALIDRARQATA